MSSWACRASQSESKNRVSEEYDPKMVKKDRHYDDYYRDDYRRAGAKRGGQPQVSNINVTSMVGLPRIRNSLNGELLLPTRVLRSASSNSSRSHLCMSPRPISLDLFHLNKVWRGASPVPSIPKEWYAGLPQSNTLFIWPQACFRFVVFQLKKVVVFFSWILEKGGCWAFPALHDFLAAVMVEGPSSSIPE